MDGDVRSLPDWLNVSRETEARLGAYLDLVEKWNPKINLISASSLAGAWSRHLLDSAQLWGLQAAPQGVWLDIGSGGGFPGIVISILAQEFAPDLRVALVESDRRKAVFLSEAVRQLQLNASVHSGRIETLPPFAAHTISARAFAALKDILPHVARHLSPEGIALLPKGQRYKAELLECEGDWVMHSEVIASKTDAEGAIVKIWGLRHV